MRAPDVSIQSLFRSARLDHFETDLAQHVGDVEVNEHFVLDNENDREGGGGTGHASGFCTAGPGKSAAPFTLFPPLTLPRCGR